MKLIDKIHEMARQAGKTIVLPEGTEERNLRAADYVLKENIASVILLGSKTEILQRAQDLALPNIEKATLIDPKDHPEKERYARMLADIRKKKGMTFEEALKLVEEPLYLSTLLIKDGKADGEVSGAEHATGDVLRPAFQIIKTLPNVSAVSGAFIMILKDKSFGTDGVMVFADCAVNPDPSVRELAEIAVESAKTAKNIAGIEPRVAMLSFSTKGSAKHSDCDKVLKALEIAKELAPDLAIDGELQADAALIPKVGDKKAPGSAVAGHANTLVFPDLDSGNIGYKLVERLAGAEAVGPIIQGLAKPVNDLSRGCSVDDIISVTAITAVQAQG